MPAYSIDGLIPVVHHNAFVHPDAVLIGDVIIDADCYVGPCASLRGDFGRVHLHHGCNVQDTCVMHAFPGMDVVVEMDGHVGHGAVLHGCVVGRNALIGMNAVVMDGAHIAEDSIVAACAFVKAGFQCEPASLVVGAPAKVRRPLREEEIGWKRRGTQEYQHLAVRSIETMRPAQPLAEVEPGRPRFDAADLRPKNQTQGGAVPAEQDQDQ